MPEFRSGDTIAALATPPGEGGIAVIRMSGPEAFKITEQFLRRRRNSDWRQVPTHTIHSGEICDAAGRVIDQVLISLFRSPQSYTGEDVIEISSHGGTAITRKILELLFQNGARHAEPGEFTRRAFLNGKIDLTQAEAVIDLIKAKSDKSLETAIQQLAGSLSRKFKALKDDMMQLCAHLEAHLDFPDENLEVYSDVEFAAKFSCLESELERLIASFKRGTLLREGAMVVIAGKPNVGKSSLFNALLERDRALVSEFPGTTRDRLEEDLQIAGIRIRLVDTAGLTAIAEHPLDQMGMEKTRQTLLEGDLFLYIVDGSRPLEEADSLVFEELKEGVPVTVLINKSDLRQELDRRSLENFTGQQELFSISTKSGEGLDQLESRIADILLKQISAEGEQITRLRHKQALTEALGALKRASGAFHQKESLEFVAVDLKASLDALRELVGEVYSEDLLDVIFAEFCIGK